MYILYWYMIWFDMIYIMYYNVIQYDMHPMHIGDLRIVNKIKFWGWIIDRTDNWYGPQEKQRFGMWTCLILLKWRMMFF